MTAGPLEDYELIEGDSDWRSAGLCRDADPELFFPVGKSGPYVLQSEQAKAICRGGCPAIRECLEWALDAYPPPHGVWGGTTREERREMRLANPRVKRYRYFMKRA